MIAPFRPSFRTAALEFLRRAAGILRRDRREAGVAIRMLPNRLSQLIVEEIASAVAVCPSKICTPGIRQRKDLPRDAGRVHVAQPLLAKIRRCAQRCPARAGLARENIPTGPRTPDRGCGPPAASRAIVEAVPASQTPLRSRSVGKVAFPWSRGSLVLDLPPGRSSSSDRDLSRRDESEIRPASLRTPRLIA